MLPLIKAKNITIEQECAQLRGTINANCYYTVTVCKIPLKSTTVEAQSRWMAKLITVRYSFVDEILKKIIIIIQIRNYQQNRWINKKINLFLFFKFSHLFVPVYVWISHCSIPTVWMSTSDRTTCDKREAKQFKRRWLMSSVNRPKCVFVYLCVRCGH